MAFPSAWIGTTLVEKKLSLITDTYSHALLPGVVISQILFGSSVISLILGAWITGLLLALITWYLARGSNTLMDSRFAFFSLLFVAAGMTISYQFQSSTEILHLLFGNVLLFESTLNWALFLLLVLVISLFIKTKSLWSLWVIDPDLIKDNKNNWTLWAFVILSFSTLYLTLGLYGVGSLMMVGLLVVPPLISRMHFKGLYPRLICSTLLIILSMTLGLALSFKVDVPIGPSLVLTLSLFYFLSWMLKFQKPKVFFPLLTLLVVFSLYSKVEAKSSPNIISTTSLLNDIALSLTAGSEIETHSLQNPARHEHEVNLSPGALQKLNSQSLILHWGFGIDNRVVKNIKNQGSEKQFCLTSKDLPNSADPHYWVYPQHGIKIISNIEKCLSSQWPEQQPIFKKNANLLIEQIQTLENSFKLNLKKANPEKLKFVAHHRGFNHLTENYGMTYLSLYSHDHHQEPSASKFNELLEKIRSEKYNLFLSDKPHLNPLSRRLIELGKLKHVGHLYSDSLPPVAKNESGYLKLLKLNFDTLLTAFNETQEQK